MGKSYLFAPGADLIAKVRDLLPKDREALAGSLVVFPGHRPAHFLRQALTASLGGPYQPPAILSMEEFVDLLYAASGGEEPRLPDLDALSILYELHRTASLPGRASPLPLNEFLPWGSKLLGDLEDLKSEQVDPARLEGLEGYAGSEIPPGQKRLLADLSGFTGTFMPRSPPRASPPGLIAMPPRPKRLRRRPSWGIPGSSWQDSMA
jgi:hypothetical protein